MKTKNVYVATAEVFQTDKRGNVKVMPTGTTISEKEFLALNEARQRKFVRSEVEVTRKARKAAIKMTVGQIPTEANLDENGQWVVRPDEFHLLKGDVADLAAECQTLWNNAFPEIPFPGINTGHFNGDSDKDSLTWWIWGGGLTGNLPPMWNANGTALCTPLPKKHQKQGKYIFNTSSLLKVTQKLRKGAEVFAYEAALDNLLAGIRA